MEPTNEERIAEIIEAEAALKSERLPYVADFFSRKALGLMVKCIDYHDFEEGIQPCHDLMVLVAELAGWLGWDVEYLYQAMREKEKPIGYDL